MRKIFSRENWEFYFEHPAVRWNVCYIVLLTIIGLILGFMDNWIIGLIVLVIAVIGGAIDERGKIVDDQLNDRTVAIALDDLKQARESVLIAGGMNKLKAIKAALAGKYANVLVTDSLVAQHLL